MKNFLKALVMIVVYLAIFLAGWIFGTLSNIYDNRVIITSECVGQGVQKSYSGIFESRDGVVVRDEKIENTTYTTTCKCSVSNRHNAPLVVVETEFSSNNADDLNNTCDAACDAWCKHQLVDYKFTE